MEDFSNRTSSSDLQLHEEASRLQGQRQRQRWSPAPEDPAHKWLQNIEQFSTIDHGHQAWRTKFYLIFHWNISICSAFKILTGKPTENRPLGRPRHRWEDNIRMDLEEIGINVKNWVDLAQDRDYC
jgi:hypothetical protein